MSTDNPHEGHLRTTIGVLDVELDDDELEEELVSLSPITPPEIKGVKPLISPETGGAWL